MVETKNEIKLKCEVCWDYLNYQGSLIDMESSRQDIIRKRLITLLEKPTKLSPLEIDLASFYMQEYDKATKISKKAIANSKKKLEYLSKLYKQGTEAIKKNAAKKGRRKNKTKKFSNLYCTFQNYD